MMFLDPTTATGDFEAISLAVSTAAATAAALSGKMRETKPCSLASSAPKKRAVKMISRMNESEPETLERRWRAPASAAMPGKEKKKCGVSIYEDEKREVGERKRER